MLRQSNTKTSVSQFGMSVAKTKSDLYGDIISKTHKVSPYLFSIRLSSYYPVATDFEYADSTGPPPLCLMLKFHH